MRKQDKELKTILYTGIYGWIRDCEIMEEDKPTIYQGIRDKKVGIYVYHNDELDENNHIVFKGFKIGYYYRSKNPFKWSYKKVYFSSR